MQPILIKCWALGNKVISLSPTRLHPRRVIKNALHIFTFSSSLVKVWSKNPLLFIAWATPIIYEGKENIGKQTKNSLPKLNKAIGIKKSGFLPSPFLGRIGKSRVGLVKEGRLQNQVKHPQCKKDGTN